MAADKNGSEKKKLGNRAGLPFELKGARQKSAAASSDKKADKASDRDMKLSEPEAAKKAKKAKEKSAVSPRAEARVAEIRAMKQRRAAKDAQRNQPGSRRGESTEIPKEVSQRMLRRMAFFSGMPIALGVGIFFLAYYLLENQIVEFAPVAVLLVTMGCFGLGVLGLTYGVLSASWDEAPGSLIGLSEFKLNFGRAVESWRAGKASEG